MKLRAHLFSRLFLPAKRSIAVLAVFYLLALFVTALAPPAKAQQTAERPSQPSERDADTGPAFLSFDDLRALSATAEPEGQLADRLQQLLTTPFLRNSTRYLDVIGELQSSGSSSGPILRVAFWNIERGLNFGEIRAALSGPAEFGHVAELRSDLSVRPVGPCCEASDCGRPATAQDCMNRVPLLIENVFEGTNLFPPLSS